MTCLSRSAESLRNTGSLFFVELSMSNDAGDRLVQIEATMAHLEHQVEQLNGVIIEQGKELEHLKRLVQRQAQTLESIELERVKATSPKPPHYGPG